MIGIDLLARPIIELVDTFGTGVMPSGGPADAMKIASIALDSAYAIGKLGIAELGGVWTGVASDAAVAKADQAQAQQVQLSDRGTEIAGVLTAASHDVNTGMVELEGILQSFISVAVAAGPTLTTPPGQIMIIAAAIDHLSRGLTVVARVRAELTAHTAKMTALTVPEQSTDPADPGAAQASIRPTASAGAGTTPASSLQQRGDAFSGFGNSFGNAASSASGNGYSGFSGAMGQTGRGLGGGNPLGRGSGTAPPEIGKSPTRRRTGSSSDSLGSSEGVEIFLPDGSTAMAPNREAADAVRNALSQQGVPYEWGGTTPGQGLDCSGLTQWAYGEAGVEIPRLAQEQSVGIPVGQSDLQPGDLAVWDGHVAMVIGNGQMVEAGDPVQVSSVRTENIGMGFHGFYRPTE
ncbi:C40 family peptidase [Rhodococcus maanshanensis]|uniref:NlpC/P60 family protein n=1 Tax=Rhodococcus maanshanensis TaxID=183556 RepID=A0A1H7XQ93_9NOCA|nr:C40 family peptidase [Rhodococcus maanshanensis]SEM35159.1 NlpC/P60 family protein [Rhodococcus maanshanensis]